MIRIKSKTIIFSQLILIVIITILTSCNSSTPEPVDKTANEYIYGQFKDWYLWYKDIPEIDPNGIDTQEALIDSIRNPLDHWSFSGSLTAINKLFQGGEYTGFGAGFIVDFDKKIKISFVYKNSPFGRAGIERGWEVTSVNGYTSNDLDNVNKALSSNETISFEFNDLNQIKHSLTITKEVVSKNTVLYSSVINSGNSKIGYFVFDSFIETSAAELDTLFSHFKNANINELIVDLRYNGGGLNSIAYQLIAMIGGSKVNGQVIAMLQHNNKHSDKDASTTSNYKGVSLNLDRVFFITTYQTASASELAINSLTPFMGVQLTGSNTQGKPVGMYVFSVKKLDLAILPICFKVTNKLGYGDYYNGLQVTTNEIDDLSHSWGDHEEAMLKSVLNSILEPAMVQNQSTLKSVRASLQQPLEYKGINQIIGAY
jgi:carboxyl-terminal processing protease